MLIKFVKIKIIFLKVHLKVKNNNNFYVANILKQNNLFTYAKTTLKFSAIKNHSYFIVFLLTAAKM